MIHSRREIINNLEQYQYYMVYFNYWWGNLFNDVFQELRLHFIINNLDFADNGRKFCSYVEELFECLSITYRSSGNFYVTGVMDLRSYRSINRPPRTKDAISATTARPSHWRDTSDWEGTMSWCYPAARVNFVRIYLLFGYTAVVASATRYLRRHSWHKPHVMCWLSLYANLVPNVYTEQFHKYDRQNSFQTGVVYV